MIVAEKVDNWIKVNFDYNVMMFNTMQKVKGARYNSTTATWAVPWSSLNDFQDKMDDFLIVWVNEEVSAGGISEDRIPDKPVVPYEFKTKPFPFQIKGFNLMVTRPFLILADDAGLGKSLQAATAMEARKQLGQVSHGVIMCKASLLFNWRDEIHMHTSCKAVVVAGNQKQRAQIYTRLHNTDDWTFLIISYSTFRGDVANIQRLDNDRSLDFCICDEAHVLKNPLSRIGDCFKYIPYKSRYVLTATPLPNSPLESFNYLKWGGKVNINWWDFRNRYAVWGGRQNKEIIMYQNISELRKCIQNNMLRRLKKDKLKELPDVTFRTIPLDMSSKQQTLYTAVKKEILEDLKDTTLEKVPSALSKLLRLQQITDSPAILGADKVESSKLTALDELLEELIVDGCQKVILFSRFRTMSEILRERYKEFNPAVIHGDIDANGKTENQAIRILKQSWGEKWYKLSSDDQKKLISETMTSERQREVYRFQNDSSCKLFIGCSAACREGLTLTAATHVIFLDVEWAWDYVVQAFSRAHRIGQKNAVTVHFLVCQNTIDEFTLKTVQKKRMLSEAMLDETSIQQIGAEKARKMIAEMIGEKV